MLKAIKKLLERSAYYISSLLTIIIIYLSLSSLSNLGVEIIVSDKILHSFAYFSLTISWFFAVQKSHKNLKTKIAVCFFILIFGIILEVLQGSITVNRMMDYRDVFANSAGILVALITFNYLYRGFKTI